MKAVNPKFLKVRGTFHGLKYVDLLLVMLSIMVASNMNIEGMYLLIVPIVMLVGKYIISRKFSFDDLAFLVSKRKSYEWNHCVRGMKNAKK